jgi:hypothetical protein
LCGQAVNVVTVLSSVRLSRLEDGALRDVRSRVVKRFIPQQSAAVGEARADGPCQQQVGLFAVPGPGMKTRRRVERLDVFGLRRLDWLAFRSPPRRRP